MFTLYFSTDHGKVKSCCHRKLKCHPMQKTCWYEDVIQMFFNVWMRCLFGLFLSSIADHKTLQLTVNYVDLICPHSICIIWPFCEHRWTKMSNSSVFVFYLYLYLYLHHPTILEAALKKKNSCVLHFYRTQVSLGSDLWVWAYVSPRLCADLTDVTLADEDSN